SDDARRPLRRRDAPRGGRPQHPLVQSHGNHEILERRRRVRFLFDEQRRHGGAGAPLHRPPVGGSRDRFQQGRPEQADPVAGAAFASHCPAVGGSRHFRPCAIRSRFTVMDQPRSVLRQATEVAPPSHGSRKVVPAVAHRRDLRLDVFRGLALWLIFLDHIPSNAVSWVTIRNYGFSDATEIFVFISGYTAAFVYGRAMQERGFVLATARVMRRACQIYAAHIFLFMIYMAEIA